MLVTPTCVVVIGCASIAMLLSAGPSAQQKLSVADHTKIVEAALRQRAHLRRQLRIRPERPATDESPIGGGRTLTRPGESSRILTTMSKLPDFDSTMKSRIQDMRPFLTEIEKAQEGLAAKSKQILAEIATRLGSARSVAETITMLQEAQKSERYTAIVGMFEALEMARQIAADGSESIYNPTWVARWTNLDPEGNDGRNGGRGVGGGGGGYTVDWDRIRTVVNDDVVGAMGGFLGASAIKKPGPDGAVAGAIGASVKAVLQ